MGSTSLLFCLFLVFFKTNFNSSPTLNLFSTSFHFEHANRSVSLCYLVNCLYVFSLQEDLNIDDDDLLNDDDDDFLDD